MSEEPKKKYICTLPTDGHQVGDEVFLTDAELANANGGEAQPRYVLADEYEQREVPQAPEPEVHQVPPATGTQDTNVPQGTGTDAAPAAPATPEAPVTDAPAADAPQA